MTTIMTLPSELHIQILKLLPLGAQIIASRVCSLWESIILTQRNFREQRYINIRPEDNTPTLQIEGVRCCHKLINHQEDNLCFIAPRGEGGEWKYFWQWLTSESEILDISGSALLDEKVVCWRQNGGDMRADEAALLDLEVSFKVVSPPFKDDWHKKWRLKPLEWDGDNGLTIKQLIKIIVQEIGEHARGTEVDIRSAAWRDHGTKITSFVIVHA